MGSVIPNGVDLDKFFIKNKKRKKNSVGYAGFLNSKKNPMRLARIIKQNPDMHFHLRIDWQDAFLKAAFEYETAGCKNIIHHGRYDDLNDFWNQMEYVISTSDIESFSFNVAEAMAAGCTPVIYNWLGADEIWREDFIFRDEPVFEKKDPVEMRDYIQSNYPLSTSMDAMHRLLLGE
jgi:glycosyltransferase involved in cell wall biosynthesis